MTDSMLLLVLQSPPSPSANAAYLTHAPSNIPMADTVSFTPVHPHANPLANPSSLHSKIRSALESPLLVYIIPLP